MEKDTKISDFIKDKGIIACDTKTGTYYLDIEKHIIYTQEEIITLMEVKNA